MKLSGISRRSAEPCIVSTDLTVSRAISPPGNVRVAPLACQEVSYNVGRWLWTKHDKWLITRHCSRKHVRRWRAMARSRLYLLS